MSRSVTIRDADHAIALLEAQVNALGADYVYPPSVSGTGTCRYFDQAAEECDPDGRPLLKAGCIVGHVLIALGFEPDVAGYSGDPIEDNNASGLVDDGTIMAPAIVGHILTAAQTAQDAGQTWGDALTTARQARLDWEAEDA